MMRSMTGFARETRVFEWGTLTVEISTVNHRYQELSLRLPREMSALEGPVGGLIRSRLGRGKVRFSAEITWAPRYRTFTIDRDVLHGYYNQLASIAQDMGVGDNPSVTALLGLPGVIEAPSLDGTVEETVGGALDETVGGALDRLIDMREREGRHLAECVAEYLQSFEALLGRMALRWEERRDVALGEHRKKLSTLLGDCLTDLDRNRVAQEIAILADKWDISEEIVRSGGHIRQFRSIADGASSEGRKLDFLIQEMNREVNTMGSKTADEEFRWMVVEAKNLLEKIREQIQNVE